MKRFVLALVLIGSMAGLASASSCRVVGQNIVVPAVAQPIYVPAYGGSYGQPQQQQNDDLMRRLVEVLERLESRLDAPAGGHTYESLVMNKCASCHTEGKNPRKDFIMVDKDGKVVDLSLKDKSLVHFRSTTTDKRFQMPPEKALTESEKVIFEKIVQ